MPFDAFALVPPRSLAAALGQLDIRPVPLDALAAHKRSQVERFAPSFWHRHQAWLPFGLIGSVGCMAASGGATNGMFPGSALPSWVCLFWLSTMTLLIVFGVFRVSAAAHWEERRIGPGDLYDQGIPTAITRRAHQLQRMLPDAELILGELIRQEVVLDPYLLMRHQDELICLGIWDGRQVIAAAA